MKKVNWKNFLKIKIYYNLNLCNKTDIWVFKITFVNFKGVNVLENQNLREGIKIFSDWPTIPQLYVKNEFIGGCDIVKEMYESGELAKLFESKNINFKAKS